MFKSKINYKWDKVTSNMCKFVQRNHFQDVQILLIHKPISRNIYFNQVTFGQFTGSLRLDFGIKKKKITAKYKQKSLLL